MRRRRRRRDNPYVRYYAEKGPPLKASSHWSDVARSGSDISNTFWEGGIVDFSGSRPSVFVGPRGVEEGEWKRSKGRRVTTYLLHPDKWSRSIRSANSMIPNISEGPGKPIHYALRVVYETPVKLSNDPQRPVNPRAWFEARGDVHLGRKVGSAMIHSTGKEVPIYDKIVVGSRQGNPGRRRRSRRR